VTHADVIGYLIGVSQNIVAAVLGVAVHHHYRVKPLLRFVGAVLQRLGEEDPKIDLPPVPKELKGEF
jgi:hypothetical protein